MGRMEPLLTQSQFIALMVGKPWVRWRSDFEAADCFGLLVLYHYAVLGMDLGSVPQTDIETGFAEAAAWEPCEPAEHAACFMAWFNGAPTHCGIILPGGMVLHSEGSPERPGSVRVSRLAAVERIYGAMKFYRYSQCLSS